ncbi:MAG: hypothetical protein ACYCZF_12620 [Anaerolineae bacterium]
MAWAQTAVGCLFLAGYIALMAVFPLNPWTDIQTFAADLHTAYIHVRADGAPGPGV